MSIKLAIADRIARDRAMVAAVKVGCTINQVAAQFAVNRSTVERALKWHKNGEPPPRTEWSRSGFDDNIVRIPSSNENAAILRALRASGGRFQDVPVEPNPWRMSPVPTLRSYSLTGCSAERAAL